jgi:DNA repair exonuclease SbcCD ATPase subunit
LSAGYKEAADPLGSRGGGVVDIVSLALRIVILELYTPRIDGPLMLDEPTKQLSKEFSDRAAELLRAISERTGRQIILVTHDPVLAKEAEMRFQL